ncbi:MAG: low molecular weight protein-tyrosine phosphatase, partial [Actinomycetota bacterium]|nr:low molecular weight protein-tyrosine phosphatase [Actinomycetota bacterium]
MSSQLHVTFICSGNICRSPMAEKMFAHQIDERGLAGVVRVTSAGTGGWHAGDRADERAGHVLHEHGYPSFHEAAQVDEEHL